MALMLAPILLRAGFNAGGALVICHAEVREQDRLTCSYVRRMTGFKRNGWLVLKTKPTETAPPNAERKTAEARLMKEEAEFRRACSSFWTRNGREMIRASW